MKKKLVSIMLCLCMVLTMMPMSVFAAEGTLHIHNDECGYVEMVEGSPCIHAHDDGCGYEQAREAVLAQDGVACDKDCADTEDDGAVDHAEDCAYKPATDEVPAVEGSPCTHQHDEVCRYAEAVEGVPCQEDAGVIVCTATDGCSLEEGHDGECAVKAAEGSYEVDSIAAFQEALSAAQDGNTIKIAQALVLSSASDILIFPAGKSLVLDMNGQSITVEDSFTGRPIKNEGTLTIKGNGTIDSSASKFGGHGAVDNYGTLTIENGTYTGSVNANGASVKNRPDATIIINDGLFNGATCALYNEGTVTINDGDFTTTSCNQTEGKDGKAWSYAINSRGTLYFNSGTVTGVQGALAISDGYGEVKEGTFKTVGCEHSDEGKYSFYALYIAGERGEVEAHIYGGDYQSISKVAALIGNDNTGGDGGVNAEATATIYGGTFTGGDNKALDAGANTGNPKIIGGTFNSDVSAYVPNSHIHTDNGDGTFTVTSRGSENSEAEINGVYYETIEDAIANASAEDTIKLLQGVTITEPIIIDKNLTIDGGKHSITGDTSTGDTSSDYYRQGLFHMFNEADTPVSFTLQNMTLVNQKSWSNPCGVSIRASNQTLTLKGVIVDVSYYGIFVGVPGVENEDVNNVTVNITDSEITGYAAVYYRTNSTTNTIKSPVLNAEDSLLFGRGYNGYGNGFSTIVYNGTRDARASIKNCLLSNSYYSNNQDANEGVIQFNNYGAYERGAEITIENSTLQTDNTSSAPNVVKYTCTQNLNQGNKVMIDENTVIRDKTGKSLIRVMANGNELLATGIDLKAVLETEVPDDDTWDTGVRYYSLLQGGETVIMPNSYEINAGATGKNQAVINLTKDLTIDGGNNTLSVTGNNTNECNLIGTDNGANVTIKNLILAGDGNVKHGINAFGESNLLLNKVTIKNFMGAGLTVNGATATATELTTFGNGWGGVNIGKGQGIIADPIFTLISGDFSEELKIWADNVDGSIPAESYVQAPTGWVVTQIDNRLVWDKETSSTEVIDKVETIVTDVKNAEDVLNNETATEPEKEQAKETINALVEEAVAAVTGIKEELTVEEREEVAATINELEESFIKANEANLSVTAKVPTVNPGVQEADKIPDQPVEVQGLAVSALAGKTISADTQVSIKIEQVPSQEQTGKIVLSIKPEIQVGAEPATIIPNDDLQAPVTFKVYLNDSFAGSYADVIHSREGGDSENFMLMVQTDDKGKFIVMTVNEFSEFIITPAFGLSIDHGGNGTSGSGSYKEGDVITINAGTKSNYRFNYWSSSNGGAFADTNAATTDFTMPANDVTLTAHWSYRGGGGGGSSYNYYDIKISKEGDGAISPDGGAKNTVTIRELNDQTFTFTPDKGYEISDVLVDGKSIGARASYTFKDVKKDHTLKVIFKVTGDDVDPQIDLVFEDVSKNDWFYDSVVNAINQGWFAGTSDTAFSPNLSATRGMIATVLWRMEKEPDTAATSAFEDVANDSWYLEGITWAQANKIVSGYGNGKFGPQDNITREQLASILYRYAQFKEYDVTKTSALTEFTDADSISEYAKTPMAWAVANGLITGKGNGILDPKTGAVRAELATILTRFTEMFSDK